MHRFAIAGHRLKNRKIIFKNPLDEIEGIGSKRKRAYLMNLVPQKQLKQQALKTYKVEGINDTIAKNI